MATGREPVASASAARWRFAMPAHMARTLTSSARSASNAGVPSADAVTATGLFDLRSAVPSPSALACDMVRRRPSLKL